MTEIKSPPNPAGLTAEIARRPAVHSDPASCRELTVADLVDMLGPIPMNRIRTEPEPGMATEQDAVEAGRRDGRLFEVFDGVLVEKAMGARESAWAYWLGVFIGTYLLRNDVGTCLGADGGVRVGPGQVRIPDLSFIRWERLPGRALPEDASLNCAPDLAVEVLSPSNTKREMERKRQEYFGIGVRILWEIDPETRTAQIYDAPEQYRQLSESDSLDGGEVLPGFTLPLATLFAAVRSKK